MTTEPTDLTELRRRMDHLQRLAAGKQGRTINRYLSIIVSAARDSAAFLEDTGRAAEAIPYYELIRDTYDATAHAVGPEDQAKYSDLARFWDITTEAKRGAVTERPRRRTPLLPEVSRESTTLTKRWGSTAPGVSLRSGGQDLAAKARKTEFKHKS